MSTTTRISAICQIAEDYGRKRGLSAFEIERVVHARSHDRDEWLVQLRIITGEASVDDDNPYAVVVVDADTELPRLVEGL